LQLSSIGDDILKRLKHCEDKQRQMNRDVDGEKILPALRLWMKDEWV